MRLYWFSMSQRPSAICFKNHPGRLQHVQRLEARDHQWPLVMVGDEPVGPRADHHAHMAGPQESIELQLRAVEDRLDGRDDGDVIAEQREIVDALALGLENGERGRGHRRLEAEPEEYDLLLGIAVAPARAHRAANRPCARRHLRLLPATGSSSSPGTRMASPKVVKITPGVSASATQSSTRPMGNTHTGQPGPCTSSIASGSMVSIPNLKIACVWPPQTSMMDSGRWRQISIRAMSFSISRRSDLRLSADRGTRRHISCGLFLATPRRVPADGRGHRPAAYAPGPRGCDRWRRGIPGCGECCRSRR